MRPLCRYPTEPLQAWARMKEIRRERVRDIWEAPQRGKMVVMRIGEAMSPLIAGVGPFVSRIYGPYFSPAMRNPQLLIKFHEAADAHNLPAGDICSAMHHQLGQIILGLSTTSPYDNAQSPVDFILQVSMCYAQKKTAQVAAQVLGVPYFVIEYPFTDETSRSDFQGKQYLVTQMEEALDWMCHITGREYDDEKLIEGAVHEWESAVLLAKIIVASRAVPTPLDYMQLREFSYMTGMLGHEERGPQFNRMLLDELQHQASQGISSQGTETARIMYEAEDIFFAMKPLMAIPRRYGALLLGDRGAALRAAWDFHPDGSLTPAQDLKEMGRHPRNRREALETMAELYLEKSLIPRQLSLAIKPLRTLRRAQAWQSDAVALLMDIGCRAIAVGFPEVRQLLREKDIPTFVFEAADSDPRYYDEVRVREQLEAFLENLGLTPLPAEAIRDDPL